MKTSSLLLLSFCALFPIASARADESPSKTAEPRIKHAHKDRNAKLFQRADTNADGKLDKAELEKMLELHKERQDKARASSQPPKSAQVAPKFPYDASAKAAKLLKHFDKDGNGTLDREEVGALMAAHKARHHRHHHKS